MKISNEGNIIPEKESVGCFDIIFMAILIGLVFWVLTYVVSRRFEQLEHRVEILEQAR